MSSSSSWPEIPSANKCPSASPLRNTFSVKMEKQKCIPVCFASLRELQESVEHSLYSYCLPTNPSSEILSNIWLLDCSLLLTRKGFPSFKEGWEEKLFVKLDDVDLIISITHIWESPQSPDPVDAQFNNFKAHLENDEWPSPFDKIGVFYDFSSLPQEDDTGNLDNLSVKQQVEALDVAFKDMLDLYSNWTPKKTVVYSAHNSSQSLNRAWPLFEMFCTSVFHTLSHTPQFPVPLVELAEEFLGCMCVCLIPWELIDRALNSHVVYTSYKIHTFFSQFYQSDLSLSKSREPVHLPPTHLKEFKSIIDEMLIHGIIVQLANAKITCSSDLKRIVDQVKDKQKDVKLGFYRDRLIRWGILDANRPMLLETQREEGSPWHGKRRSVRTTPPKEVLEFFADEGLIERK